MSAPRRISIGPGVRSVEVQELGRDALQVARVGEEAEDLFPWTRQPLPGCRPESHV